jgi:hypothetical protein
VALIAHKGAVDLLLRILESQSGRISGAVMHASFGEAGRRLVESKLLLSTGQTDIFSVMDDYEDDPVRVEWSAEQESYGYFTRSGQWSAVPAEDLAFYKVTMPIFFSQLLVRCERGSAQRDEVLIPEVVWDLGSVKLESRGQPVSVWFARRLFDSEQLKSLEALALRRPAVGMRVIITSTTDALDVDLPGIILAKRMKMVPASQLKPIGHSADYGQIRIGQQIFIFRGDLHRQILKILVDAYNRNDAVCRTSQVLEDAGARGKTNSLARAFSKNADWHKFIKEKAGNCWIEF